MFSSWHQSLYVGRVGVAFHVDQEGGREEVRGALGLLVQDVVSRVSQQRPVVRVEEHFLRAPVGLALTLRTVGVEEEDVAVTVAGSNVEMVRTPLSVIDGPVALSVDVVVVL